MPRKRYHHAISRALNLQRLGIGIVWAVAVWLSAGSAWAHPFGISSVSRYLAVEMESGALHVAYVLDFAELPAVSELARLDANGDGAVTPEERDGYLDALFARVVPQWQVFVNGRPVQLRVLHRSIEAPPGEGGLSTLRVLAEFATAVHAESDEVLHVRVRDDVYAEHPGFRDIRAEGSAAAVLLAGNQVTAPTDSSGVRRVDEATFVFRVAGAPKAHTCLRGLALACACAAVALLAAFSWFRRTRRTSAESHHRVS